ncbi:MAG TPA: adenylyl-sulfate kinase [Candidatus Methylacidiphilales bacterium]|jgi:adenylylsulfate kinase|nr:adenylyl-sulfate kinase [Candidatus Methylacidiphilales bacterium]
MSDIHPIYDHMLSRTEREKKLRQRAKVVWLYGLSGSGKSTLATALEGRLFAEGFVTTHLDGDNVRDGLNRGLGFSDADREENIRRVAEVSKLFVQSGVICVNSFITPRESLRQLARGIVGETDLLEIYVECSFETCRKRDVKGLYKRVDAGLVPNFTGKESAFEPPARPDLVLNTETAKAEDSLESLYSFVLGQIRIAA